MVWNRTKRPLWLRCTVGALLALSATALRLQFLGVLELREAFLTFFPAVALAALYGGFFAGMAATLASGVFANLFFIESVGRFSITNSADMASMTVFLSSCVLVSYMAEAAYRALVRAHKAEEESRLAAGREKAALELQESERRYRELVQNANSAIIRWKHDGTITFFNEYAEAFFGYGAEEVLGKNVSILVPPQESTGTDLSGLVRDIVDNPARYSNYANENVRKDGSRAWMAWTNRPIFDENGQLQEILAIGCDITERRLAMEKVRTQNAILETINLIFHNALTCETEEQLGATCLKAAEELTGSKYGFIGEYNRNGRLYDIAISDPAWEACAMYGQSGHRGRPVSFKIHGLYGRVLTNGRSLLTNTPESHPDSIGTPPGHPPLTAFLGVPLVHDGKVMGIIGLASREGGYGLEQLLAVEAIAPAILEALMRKRTELTLNRSEARLKLLSETASQLLASPDPQAIVEKLCRQVMQHLDCQAFFNYLAVAAEGKLFLNACAGIPEEEARKIEWLDYGVAVCGCAAQAGKRIVAEDICNTPDIRTDLVKSYGIQAYACHPLESQGKTIGTLSFGTKTRTHFSAEDLSLMKTVADQVATAMEKIILIDELRNSRDELEMRVRERTAQLERSNKALQDFVSIASHDLQEPLRKVTTFGDMLKQRCHGPLGEQGNGYLDRMLDANRRMQSLLTALLEYSRLTTRADPFTKTDLADVVDGVLSDLEVKIEMTGGEVQVGKLPVIEADPTQMRQLFQNLIGNALKFHREDKKPVIKVSASAAGANLFQIVIEDNGIGIDGEHVGRIFAPFQRLHGRSSPYEGTGMGLAICKKIVERHGGGIRAESTRGKGSLFIVDLPARQPKR
ncbi:MAG: GAF domain-containing protein [Syntrophobacteraceae bacterium]|nr:GAF domain-containing protein [Desulfobacteraceae bacterium]